MKRVLLLKDAMGQGGAERQLSYLAINLKKAGHHIRLIQFYNVENAYEKELLKYGIKTEVAECGASKWKRPFYIARLVRQWDTDAVIAYQDGVCIACCLAKLFTKYRLIVSERNTTQRLSKYERIKFQLYRMADVVVPNSQSQAQFLKTYASWLRDKTKVITNMIDTEKFKFVQSTDLSLVKPRVITVARISPQKNVLGFLDAIAILKSEGVDVHFDWYGYPEYPVYYEQVLAKVSALKLEDFITFHGGVQNIEDCYHTATHFCLPSLYEGFPNVLCEAMATGLICTASDIFDNPHILTDNKMRFNPSDTRMMAEIIKYSLELPEAEQRKISKFNHDRIVKLCSPEAFMTQYESLL